MKNRILFYEKQLPIVFVLVVTMASFMLAQDGFGSNVTGGAGGASVTVNNGVDFIYYATSSLPYVITVSGTIVPWTQSVYISSNKTIQGADENATISGNLIIQVPNKNVIIKNLNISNPWGVADGDGITIMLARDIFITHCTFFDCGDGECDIVGASDNVTLSWCRFRYISQIFHNYVNLIGNNDSNIEELGSLHVTIHHCWYDQKCVERMPSVRFGRVHVYNNYFNAPGNNYCVRTRLYAECLVENNYFENVQNPWELLTTIGTTGRLRAAGNNVSFMDTSNGVSWVSGWYPGQSLITGNDAVFTPPYSYTLDNVQDVKNKIIGFAGNVQPFLFDKNYLNFGTVPAGDSVIQSVVVTNTSATNSVSIIGVNSISGYSIAPQPPIEYPIILAPGASRAFDAVFKPSSGGVFAGNILFAHNDPDGTTSLTVYGKGFSSGPDFVLNTCSLDFGDIIVGSSTTLPVTVTNTGASNTLSITDVSSFSPYTVMPNPPGAFPINVGPGSSRTFDITFTPVSANSFSGNIAFAHNAPGGTTILSVSGVGLDPPEISVLPNSYAITLSSGDSMSTSMTISNTGNSNLKYKIYLQGSYRSENKTDIAIVHASIVSLHVEDVVSKLLATDKFNIIGLFHADKITPLLQHLQGSKAILVFSEIGSSWQNRVELGNVLAAYINSGGGVVCGIGATAGNAGEDLGGDFSQYQLITFGKAVSYSGSLGEVYLPSHPIMQGVTSFSGGVFSYHPVNTSITTGSVKVADWNDGKPLIVYKDNVGLCNTRRVDLGFFPPSDDAGYGLWNSSTDGAKIIANALLYVDAGEKYVSMTIDSGTIAPGASNTLDVKFNARYLNGGDYNGKIIITSNDPIHNSMEIPISLHVDGEPSITVTPDSVTAGTVCVGTSFIDTIKVKNTGTDVLNVLDIGSSLSEFTPDISTFSLSPGGERAVALRFIPEDSISYNGMLTITSNDVLNPTIDVIIRGRGVYFNYILNQGWSLVSVPYTQSNDSVHVVFPGSFGDAMWYLPGSGYVPSPILENGKGYWIYFQDTATIPLGGVAPKSLIVDAQAGWNLVGSHAWPAEVSSLGLSSGAMIFGEVVYIFASGYGYIPITQINPGVGVWMYVTKACTITFPNE